MRVSTWISVLLSACIALAAMPLPAIAQGTTAKPVAKPPTAAAETAVADTSSASDAQKQSARSHFKLGVDFYRERNYRAALIEFQRAYADSPHYKLLYNLGQASLELQEYASAIDYLTDYLKEGGDEISAERKAEVEQTLRYLESRIAYVRIATNEAGAELYVDDTLVGKSPLQEPVRVGAGRHKFSAVREGQPPVERRIDVAAGDESEVRLDFQQALTYEPLASAPPAPVDDSYDEPSSASYTAAIVMGAATGALLLGAVAMTLVTGGAQQSYQEELLVPTTRSRIDDLRDDAESKALVTDILWGVTAASAVVTTILIATSGSGESDATARTDSGQRSGVAVRAGLGSLAVTGQF
jgi:tetratricopeptide (TPR) repeat protein